MSNDTVMKKKKQIGIWSYLGASGNHRWGNHRLKIFLDDN